MTHTQSSDAATSVGVLPTDVTDVSSSETGSTAPTEFGVASSAVARAKRQREDNGDDRDCEERAAEREEATADASPPAPDGDRRGPEPERGSRVVGEGIAVLVPLLRLLRERTCEDRVRARRSASSGVGSSCMCAQSVCASVSRRNGGAPESSS